MAFSHNHSILIDDLPFFFELGFATIVMDATMTCSGKCPSIDEFVKTQKIPSTIIAYKPPGASSDFTDSKVKYGAAGTLAGVGTSAACIVGLVVGGPITIAAAAVTLGASVSTTSNLAYNTVSAVNDRAISVTKELTLFEFLEHIDADVAEYIRSIYKSPHAVFGYSPTFKAIQFVARLRHRALIRAADADLRRNLVLQNTPFDINMDTLRGFLSREPKYASIVIGLAIRYSYVDMLEVALKFGSIHRVLVKPDGCGLIADDALYIANFYNSDAAIYRVIMDHGVLDAPHKYEINQNVFRRMIVSNQHMVIRYSDVTAIRGNIALANYIMARSRQNAINVLAKSTAVRNWVRHHHMLAKMSIAERAVYETKKTAVAAKKYARHNRVDVYYWMFAAAMVLPMFLIMRTVPAKVPASIVGSTIIALAIGFEKPVPAYKFEPTTTGEYIGVVFYRVATFFVDITKPFIAAGLNFMLSFIEMPMVCGLVAFALSNIGIILPYLSTYAAFICGMIASAFFNAHLKKRARVYVPAGGFKICVVLLMSGIFSIMA